MANNFLSYKKLEIGKSLVETNTNNIIKNIYDKAKKNRCEVIIREDCVVGTSIDGEGKTKFLNQIKKNEIILDIGPNSIKTIKQVIDQSNTLLWNGPAGYFENENFSNGTMSIARLFQKI